MAVLKKNQVNQILFVMTDKTDFATLETSLASNFTVKRFGVNHGSAAANVSTLSRIVSKVGSGIYRLSLEANACNYDYIALRIAHASAATQMLVYEMRTYDDTDTFSQLSDIGSNIQSYLVGMSGVLSDVYSQLSDFRSDFGSRVPKEMPSKSLVSDYHSDLKSAIGGITVTIGASDVSDIASAVIAGMTTLTPSDISDIASAVWANAIGARVDSRVLLNQSRISDVYSLLSDFASDFGSRVPKAVATNSQLSDLASDIRSYLVGISGAISDVDSALTSQFTAGHPLAASDMSDIRSAILSLSGIISDAHSAAAQANSRALVLQLSLSDVDFALSSQFGRMSDYLSDLLSVVTVTGVQLNASSLSDIRSVVLSLSDAISNAYSAAVVGASRTLVIQSMVSDVDSALTSQFAYLSNAISDMHSDVISAIGNVSVAIGPSDISDIASAVAAGITTLGPSDISDIASAVWAYTLANKLVTLSPSDISDIRSAITAGGGIVSISASDISDIASAVWANTIGARVDSRILINQSRISDMYSLLSDFASDFGSRVPKAVATNSQLSDLASDIRSYLVGISGAISDVDSALTSQFTAGHPLTASDMSDIRSAILSLSGIISDAHSAAAQANSRTLVLQSSLSDVDSTLSSQFAVLNSSISDIDSALSSQFAVLNAGLSDIGSALDAQDSAFTDATSLTANTAKDRLRTMGWVLRNKIKINDTTGAMDVYKDDDATVGISGTATDDTVSTVRTRLA